MQHNKILNLVLLFGILVTTTITVSTNDIAFAAEDAEEEEQKDSEKEETKDEDEEEEGSKDEDKKEESEEGSKEEESKEEPVINNNDTTQPPELIANLTGDQILNLLEPVVNPVEEINTTPAEQPIATTTAEPIIDKEFNATCKCTTIGGKPTTNTTPTTIAPQGQQEQIPVTNADIQDSKSFGEVIDPAYTNYYTVPNLLDTIINDVSFWSQAGKSSFYIKLDNVLDSYQVCSMELNVYQPKSTPFLLDIGVSQNYTGVLDQPTERIQFDKCVKNMDEIFMIFDNPSNSFISISEIKLFGSKLTAGSTITQPTPTIIAPTLEPKIPTENATKINIQDSTAEIDIKNSTVTFKFDPLTGIFKGAM
jgi:hypothetical protein